MPRLECFRCASNCGLISANRLHRRRRQRQGHRQHGFQRNEADIDDDDIGSRRQAPAFEVADIGLFHRDDSGVAVQRGMQLAAADVDREYQAGAVRQQHLGKAAGRRADVEADMVLDINGILLQRARQLDAAARDIGMRGLRGQCRVGGDGFRGFCHRLAVGNHKPGVDGRARPCPAFEQAALDQKHIRALARSRFVLAFRQGSNPVCSRRDPPRGERRPRKR